MYKKSDGFVVWEPWIQFSREAPKYHHVSKVTQIYVLLDPRDRTVRYVGVTSWPERRLYEHRNQINQHNSRVRSWVESMKSAGFEPEMVIVGSCTQNNWGAAERRWIKFFRANGKLYNIKNGGVEAWRQTVKPKKKKRRGHYDICARKKQKPNMVAKISPLGIVRRNVHRCVGTPGYTPRGTKPVSPVGADR